jgi:hypothetical protein
MVPIFLDLRDVAAEFNLSRGQVEGMLNYSVKEVTAEFARQWDAEARQKLNSTRQLFSQSLVVVDTGKLKGAVMLLGKFANALEDGEGAYDMKPGFAASPKRHIVHRKDGSTGWYITIPFRFATPSALGESSVFTSRMPEQVYAVAKSQPTSLPIGGGTRSAGLTVSQLPQGYNQPASRPGVSNVPRSQTFDEYTHKTSIFAGIQKVKDSETGQNRYVSFRRVSDLSDPNAFVHPGILAGKFAEKALNSTNIPYVVDRSIDQMLVRFGF